MSKPSNQRFENCYMPPKKFHWRFDGAINPPELNDVSVREAQTSHPVNGESSKMVSLFENNLKPNSRTGESSSSSSSPDQKSASPAKKPSNQDVPLDFSVRNPIRGSSNESPTSADKPISGGSDYSSPGMNYSDYLRKFQSTAFPGMPNGGHTTPPPMGSGNPGNWLSVPKDSQPLNENRSPPNMGSPRNHSESLTTDNEQMDLNHGSRLFKAEQRLSRENSPAVTGGSILQGMLKAQDSISVNKISSKIQDININAPEPLRPENGVEFLNASHIMNAANSHMLPPLMTPVNNLMQLGGFPFLGGMGYMGSPIGALTGGLLSQTSDAAVLQASALAHRRVRRKKSDDRPFKCYPMEVLEEKLQTVSANALAFGLEYRNQILSSSQGSSPPGDQESSVSMVESSERVNGAINPNPCVANGIENTRHSIGSGDSNDSLPSVRPETAEATSCTNVRKRKSTADVEKDDAYWDRRRKNNLAAKRSREARRRKEDAIANMAVLYENQNVELKKHTVQLSEQLNETTSNLYRLMREHENMRIQHNILQERLSQKRCGHCGAQLPTVN